MARRLAGRDSWSVLAILLVLVLVPTTCVLWFMGQAVRNERLAVHQKLSEAYGSLLHTAQGQFETYWSSKVAAIEAVVSGTSASEAFSRLATSGLCESVIVYDSSGGPRYPASAEPPAFIPGPEWQQAEALEYREANLEGAAAVYERIAARVFDLNVAAMALQAQARCLAKAGRPEAAVGILSERLDQPDFRGARDPQGRFVVPHALLYAMQLRGEPASPPFGPAGKRLIHLLNGYSEPAMPSSQRVFLMQQFTAPSSLFETLVAERLAADYLMLVPTPRLEAGLLPTPLPDVLQLALPEHGAIALFSRERLLSDVQSLIDRQLSLGEVSIQLRYRLGPEENHLLAIPAGKGLPEWSLALYLQGQDPFEIAAARQVAIHIWTGIFVIALIALFALLLARSVLRQLRLTRLKNDLIATVSHELKTPLSSMRVLVDTLREGRCRDEKQEREYLELIAKENVRLSRLIDNFLTFSRMERNKRTFEFHEVSPEDVVRAVVETVRERFEAPGCRLEVDVAPGLPSITADPDALVTVLLNLLDNAYKYTGENKHVILRAYTEGGAMCFEVEDNGVGLSRRAAKKIFDRFYQVDQSLSRSGSGCGLGLSIVKFIVAAHGGTIRVRSRPGKGSTFRVRLPIAKSV